LVPWREVLRQESEGSSLQTSDNRTVQKQAAENSLAEVLGEQKRGPVGMEYVERRKGKKKKKNQVLQ